MRGTFAAQLCVVLKLGHFGNGAEIPAKFRIVVVEKDGEDQLGRECEERRTK